MNFWFTFANVWDDLWKFIDTPVVIGDFEFSIGWIIILSLGVTICAEWAYRIIYQD